MKRLARERTYIFAFGLPTVTETAMESRALELSTFPMTTQEAEPGVFPVNNVDGTDRLETAFMVAVSAPGVQQTLYNKHQTFLILGIWINICQHLIINFISGFL